MKEDANKQLRQRVEQIDEEGRGLTKWEIEFIGRMIDEDVRRFSDKQAEVINRIYRDRVRDRASSSNPDGDEL